LEYFFARLGFTPKRLISDFDSKLIGGKARDYLNSLRIHLNAAPAHRQDRNGLVERHWQSLTTMAHNWLASAELPASFWFYAVHRAAEVCNYFPISWKMDLGPLYLNLRTKRNWIYEYYSKCLALRLFDGNAMVIHV